MIAGKDFSSFFDDDLFTLRRSGSAFDSGNPYDPESLLTGGEAARGLDYGNSRRSWPNEETYRAAVGGHLTTEQILRIAPRVPLDEVTREQFEAWSANPWPVDHDLIAWEGEGGQSRAHWPTGD